MSKATVEKLTEAADKPVPDETLTLAWWDYDPQLVSQTHHIARDASRPRREYLDSFLNNAAAQRRPQKPTRE
jgi:hypothetical protein